MKKIYFLTEERFLNPDQKTRSEHSVYLEDKLLIDQINSLGYQIDQHAWDDKNNSLPEGSLAIFRSTWIYHKKLNEFREWLSENEGKINFLNSLETIRWNLDKQYLIELGKAGVPSVETLTVNKSSGLSLSEIIDLKQWQTIVVKPSISASAHNTFKVTKRESKLFESKFQELLRTDNYIIQEFQENILTHGEISLVYINGIYTHAVLKQAKVGDYRVQSDFGGTIRLYEPSDEQIALGQRALANCPDEPIYGRVDIIYSNSRRWEVSEIEVFEPELWFRLKEDSAKLMAQAIHNYASSAAIFS